MGMRAFADLDVVVSASDESTRAELVAKKAWVIEMLSRKLSGDTHNTFSTWRMDVDRVCVPRPETDAVVSLCQEVELSRLLEVIKCHTERRSSLG